MLEHELRTNDHPLSCERREKITATGAAFWQTNQNVGSYLFFLPLVALDANHDDSAG